LSGRLKAYSEQLGKGRNNSCCRSPQLRRQPRGLKRKIPVPGDSPEGTDAKTQDMNAGIWENRPQFQIAHAKKIVWDAAKHRTSPRLAGREPTFWRTPSWRTRPLRSLVRKAVKACGSSFSQHRPFKDGSSGQYVRYMPFSVGEGASLRRWGDG